MNIGALLWRNRTKVLGFAQGAVAALAGIAGLIPTSHLPYWLAASALLTLSVGFFNSITLAEVHDDGTAGESQ